MNIENKIRKLIDKQVEGEYWDFKQEWHKENERLIHDILCFANTIHNEDCYIIVGVSDDGEVVGVCEENRVKQAGLLDLLSNCSFAGDNVPEVRLNTFLISEKEIDVITIYNSFNVPFFLKSKSRNYNSIKEGYIYTRIGDKNTPISQNANFLQIEMLWKKRLGLTQPPLEQIVNRLSNKLEWYLNGETFYNLYKPEFQLVEEYNDDNDRLKGEFYVYTQTNARFSYKNLKIMYHQTILKEFQLVVLDSGRYVTPVPTWGFVGYEGHRVNNKITYKYYLKDGIDYELQQFYYDHDDSEEVHAKSEFDEVILYYENERERELYELYVEKKQELLKQYISEAHSRYFTIDCRGELEKQSARERLSTGLALNKLLIEFRGRGNQDS
jgi:hypothetical protein